MGGKGVDKIEAFRHDINRIMPPIKGGLFTTSEVPKTRSVTVYLRVFGKVKLKLDIPFSDIEKVNTQDLACTIAKKMCDEYKLDKAQPVLPL